MLPFASINIWAVLVAAAAQMVVGGLWFSPFLFSKPWLKYMGWDPKEFASKKKGAEKAYLFTFLAAIVSTLILAAFFEYFPALTMLQGLTMTWWLWLGFFAMPAASGFLFEHKPWGLYLIVTGHVLAAMLASAAILVAWQ